MMRLVPGIIAFLLTISTLVPSALTLPQHGDERQYVWTAGYYGARLARLDLSPEGTDAYGDPGLSPRSWWALTQPMGARAVYAVAMGLTGTPAPSLPYSYSDARLQGPETAIPAATVPAVRLAAILCAALGLSLIVFRLGWAALIAVAAFLAVPDVRDDLSRAWAEGPLMLGFGLAALSYGTRWFAPMCGFAATFKLTALGLWPLAFWHGFGRSRYQHILAVVVASATWTVLTPPAWFSWGPSYLVNMLVDRGREYAGQSTAHPDLFGLFLPPRYLWPLELGALLAASHVAPRIWRMVRLRRRPVPLTLPGRTGMEPW